MADYGLMQVRWLRGRPAGQPGEDEMVNTIHCQTSDGGWSEDDRDVVHTQWANLMLGELNAMMSSDVKLDQVRLYNLPATSGPLGDPAFTISFGTPGSGSPSATLPPQCAVTVTWLTSSRRHWGRIYLGGFVNTLCSNGRVEEGNLSTIADQFQSFGQALRDAGIGIVVWDRTSWTAYDVQELQMDDVWDVQRRRRYSNPLFRNHRDITP